MDFAPAPPAHHTRYWVFFDLRVFQLDRGGPAENIDCHLEAAILVVDLFHDAIEAGEVAIDDIHCLADLVVDRRRGRSASSSIWPRIRFTSFSDTGIGFLPEPRKPVTFGVDVTR